MPFLTPNKQRQSTEGTTSLHWFDPRPSDHNMMLAARCCAVAPATNIDQSINQSINVKFVWRRYSTRRGTPTVVSGKHDHKLHS